MSGRARRARLTPLAHALLWLGLLLPRRAGAAGTEPARQNVSFFYEEEGQDVCRRFQTGGMERLSEFASPNFPSKYPPNTDCIRIIHAPPGYDIVLRFNDVFQIETSYEDSLARPKTISHNCPNDFLEIRDGRYSFSPLVGRFCGMRAPPDEVRVHSGFAWLNFHSDALIQERGFSAEYEFVRKWNLTQPTRTHECHFTSMQHLDGYINTTALQSFYRSDEDEHAVECVYQIRVPAWLHVAVYVEQFELATPNQCDQNFLEIYAGPTARRPTKRYCGVIATHTYTGQSVVFLRTFMLSARHARHSRLRVLFSSYAAFKNCTEHDLFACGDDICIPKALVCNGKANCLYRRDESVCEIETPGFLSIFTNSYSPLFFTPVLLAATVTIMGLWYKPCRQVPLTADDDLPRLAAVEEESASATASVATTLLDSSRSEAVPQPPAGILSNARVSAETQTPRPRKHASFLENGHCNRGTSTTASLDGQPAEVWRTAESASTTPSLVMENISMETSFVTINV